jgi:hypothetical protein
MMSLEGQLADYGQLQEELFGPINVDEIASPTVPPRSVEVGKRPMRPKLGRGLTWAAAAFAVVLTLGGLYLAFSGADDQVVDQTTVPTPTTILAPMPVEGSWVTTDADGSTPIMTVQVSGEGVVEITVLDDLASVCAGAPSTMTGSGRLEGDTTLVIPTPVLTCDDGTEPQALSGGSLEEILRDLTFTHDPGSDTLSDNNGSAWHREGAEEPTVVSGMWPQSNLEEVREAQERADAGDPPYAWQLDETLDGDAAPWGAEIFARFIEEELGWEEYTGGWDGSGYMTLEAGGVYEGVTFIRCAPGEANPLNPLYADMPPEIRGCAPTIDELTYETVSVDVSQPSRKGPDGIWVVNRWEMLQPKSSDPGSLFGLLYPEYDQVMQGVPPTEAEVTPFLEAFLQARVDGEGAEPYLLHEPEESPFPDREVPILYATTGGAPYQRFEIEKVRGPVWPNGWTEYKVRLFAEGGTVVEQYFFVIRQENGQLGLVYGYKWDGLPTTENGQSVAVTFTILDGEVTLAAAPPWGEDSDTSDTLIRFNGSRDDHVGSRDDHVVIATDPLPVGTGCESTSTPADAEALARQIMADPNFETTGTVPVRIAGIEGLQMDVDAVVGDWNSYCWAMWVPDQANEWRMRLYLIDYPGDSAQVLTISVIAAPETDFERVLEETTPIVDSIELHTG